MTDSPKPIPFEPPEANDMWKADDYRTFVGPYYDLIGAHQFNVLVSEGLREEHSLLDIGCGSLRGGRFFIVYLLPEKYTGIDPNFWLVEKSIQRELSRELVFKIKKCKFVTKSTFSYEFDEPFDYILAQSIFSHACQDQIATCLDSIYRCLSPIGKAYITYVKGKKDYLGKTWVYPPEVPGVVKYREDTMRQMVETANLSYEELDYSHPNGQTWVKLKRK